MKFSYLTVFAFAATAVGQAVTFTSGLNSRKCMDLAGFSTANGTHVQIWDCTGATNQQWIVNRTTPSICSQMDARVCLDIQEPTPDIGSHVVVNGNNSAFLTQRYIPTFRGDLIEIITTGLCIEVPGDDTTNGNQLQLAVCNGEDSGQVWDQIQPGLEE